MRSPVNKRERYVYPLLFVVVFGLFLFVLLRGLSTANVTRQALCTLRSGYDDDIAAQLKQIPAGRRFVRKNPTGAFGFTQAQLRKFQHDREAALATLRQRRKALSILHC